MKLKPWYDVTKPREDLREGESQDASEFAVHLDRVRDGTAREDYKNPEQFFAKTSRATNLLDLVAQTARRLSGETTVLVRAPPLNTPSPTSPPPISPALSAKTPGRGTSTVLHSVKTT